MVKYIRLSKKIKSGNVYTGILSRPAISRFEKGLSDTTTVKLFKIISNLNVSLDEFYYIYNKKNNMDNDYNFYNEYTHSFYLNDLESLKLLRNTAIEAYKSTNKIKHLHYSSLTDLTISYILKEKNNIESLKILKDYLLECDEWTYYELVLFTNSLDFFPEELLLLLHKKAKEKLEYFSQLRRYSNEVFSLLTNILVVFITKNDIEKSTYFYKELKKSMSETNNKMYEKVMLSFFKELIGIIDTKKSDAQTIEQIIILFDYLEMPVKKNQCVHLYENVKSNNQIE
ncbi:Rgg/GadR/MutR family transcriptional regulator [Carnobacterium pleistocenium]|uniref:Rgg/GadR/MutR family transcriptional regulator n=1 Tax=Carnobacterium pleistocenium TaxID=181073 RepID=UPI00055592DB|nr:Rgg/GadR/MutR family transcriptional regulator [Carnobacterium pleistocenium]